MNLRFELCSHHDINVSAEAKREFFQGVTQLLNDLPGIKFLPILERAVDMHVNGLLTDSRTSVCQAVHWAKNRYGQLLKQSVQAKDVKDWTGAISRVQAMIDKLEGGEFSSRLRIAVGRAYDHTYEEVDGNRLYAYQKRIKAVAGEAAQNPSLMTEEAWAALADKESNNALEFAQFLGRADYGAVLPQEFEKRSGDWNGAWLFAAYLWGRHESQAEFVDQQIDRITESPTSHKLPALFAVKLIGPSPTNVGRLSTLIEKQMVTPTEVAQVFSTGRWFEELEPAKVANVFEYIASDTKLNPLLLDDLSLYLHVEKALPRELFPAGLLALRRTPHTTGRYDYECDCIALGIAKTDLDAGLSLLQEQMERVNGNTRRGNTIWNPLETLNAGRFWKYLREKCPERAYRIFGKLRPSASWLRSWGHTDYRLLDLAEHQELLLTIAGENKTAAEALARSSTVSQAGFFDFAYAILGLYPNDDEIVSALSDAICEQTTFVSDGGHYAKAIEQVEGQLRRTDIPVTGRSWLESLKAWLNNRLKETSRNSDPDGSIFWDC